MLVWRLVWKGREEAAFLQAGGYGLAGHKEVPRGEPGAVQRENGGGVGRWCCNSPDVVLGNLVLC